MTTTTTSYRLIDHRTPIEKVIEALKATMCHLGPDCHIDACFINFPCRECGAKVDRLCTIDGDAQPETHCADGAPDSVPRFRYHSFRTKQGLELWEALQQLGVQA